MNSIGYGTVAVSGGEPLLYRGLGDILAHARSIGLRTQVTTNGTLANDDRLSRLARLVDVLAFSLDGPPDQHNVVRGAPWAFDKLVAGLETATRLGIPHGILYTVTASSWPYVDWAARFATFHHCALFQVHAIEGVGRAEHEMHDELLAGDLIEFAYVAGAQAADAHGDEVHVHSDVVHRSALEGADGCIVTTKRPPVLVVEEDGVVVPYAHGFSRAAAVTDLNHTRLRDAWPGYADEVVPRLTDFVRATKESLLASDRRVFDWYAELVEASASIGAAGVPVTLGRPS